MATDMLLWREARINRYGSDGRGGWGWEGLCQQMSRPQWVWRGMYGSDEQRYGGAGMDQMSRGTVGMEGQVRIR